MFAQTFNEYHHILSEKLLKMAFQIEKKFLMNYSNKIAVNFERASGKGFCIA